MNEYELKEILLRESGEFRKAFEDHRTCELELEKLRLKTHVTEADALAEREIKKRKLVLKDRMYQLMLEHEKTR
ncbi:MAG: hypothetical protein ACXVI6_05300 [Candidatus Aminicenantales bacterium]